MCGWETLAHIGIIASSLGFHGTYALSNFTYFNWAATNWVQYFQLFWALCGQSGRTYLKPGYVERARSHQEQKRSRNTIANDEKNKSTFRDNNSSYKFILRARIEWAVTRPEVPELFMFQAQPGTGFLRSQYICNQCYLEGTSIGHILRAFIASYYAFMETGLLFRGDDKQKHLQWCSAPFLFPFLVCILPSLGSLTWGRVLIVFDSSCFLHFWRSLLHFCEGL